MSDAFPGLITREEWAKGLGAIGRLGAPMATPIRTLILHHTVTSAGSDPIVAMRQVNQIGRARFNMHSYNWNFWPDYVHEQHRVLQGQGGRVGAHTSGWNTKAAALSWIGNYERNVPGHPTLQVIDSMVTYTAGWVGYLIDNGVVAPNPQILHHGEIGSTACPGDHWLEGPIHRLRELVAAGHRLQSWGKAALTIAGSLTAEQVVDTYRALLGRTPNEQEVALWLMEAPDVAALRWAIEQSAEHRAYQARPPAPPAPVVEDTAAVLRQILSRLDALEARIEP